jgi:hypothetical protein
MGVAVKEQHPSSERFSKHSYRLKQLNEEAAKVRQMHERGEITSQEASKRLSELKKRHRTFFDRFF